MSRIRALADWLRTVATRSRAEDELDEELRDHVERELQRQLAGGASREEAVRRTALRVGNVAAAKDAVRDVRRGRLIADAITDVRIGLRGLRRNRGFTLAVVLSLGLGVGGATAISSVVHAVLLRSMPYPDAGRLHVVRVWWDSFSASLSPADLEILRERSAPVGSVGAFSFPDDGFTMMTESGPEVVDGAYLTRDLLQVLEVAPARGPGFSIDDAAREVLISDRLWRSQFGARADVVGRTVVLDSRPATIVGVMPAGFTMPGMRAGDAWVKRTWQPPTRRGPFFLLTVIRLRRGMTPEAAARELTSLVAPVMQERFGGNPNWGYGVRSILDTVVGDSRGTLMVALGAVGLVLIIAILNVANLLLARGTVRVRELAVRASLGAGRRRLARQLLTESALLGFFGGALGLLLAAAALGVVRETALAVLPRMHEVQMDARIALVAFVTGIGAGLLAGAIPVLRIRWVGLTDVLRDGGRSVGTGRRYAAARRLLVAIEVALALTVLTSAALLAKTIQRLESADPGFTPAGVVTFRLSLPDNPYGPERTRAFLADLEARLRTIPGTTAVAFSSALPPNNLYSTNNFTVEGQTNERGGGIAEQIEASAAFFDALGIRMVRGRGFETSDRRGSQRVAIVNETLAKQQFRTIDVIGRRFKNGGPDSKSPWTTIVGVAADVPYAGGVWGGSAQTVYTPYDQNLWTDSPFVVVKSTGDLATLAAPVREAVRAIDPALPLRDVATMDERLRRSTLLPRFRTGLALALAVVALALAVTGIYGVMAYHVTQRHRENAIRRALGAREGQIIGEVMASGIRLAAVGIAFGIVGALAATRTLGSLLYQVTPQDPAVLASGVAVLTCAALAACVIPASRAARTDPMMILRDE